MSFAERVIAFNDQLSIKSNPPPGIRIMNPFSDSSEARELSATFYRKYYNDNNRRRIILGINPGRHGAGLTGIPFTDTKRLIQNCGINVMNLESHEVSSVFIYRMIDAFGGVEKFYNRYYINSVCPLGFVRINPGGREVNFNYYDSVELTETVSEFILESLRKQIEIGIDTDHAFCLGAGKNFKYLDKLNKEYKLFGEIIPLDHPRYIIQYKSKDIELYVKKYLDILD